MRSTNVILLIVLLACGFTSSFDFASFVELGELKNDPYGKSLIETISMSLEKVGGGKIENIQALLDDLLVKLMNEQKNADADWAKESKRLKDDIAKLDLEITRLRAEIGKLKRERVEFTQKKTRAEANIKQYTEQKTQDVNTLNDLIIKRRRDKVFFKNSQKEHAAVSGAIEQVIGSLVKLRGSIAGVNKPTHVAAIHQEVRDIKAKLVEIVGDDEEAQAFAELATEADQGALNRLIAILNNLLRNVKKSMADDDAHNRTSKATFTKLKLGLKEDIKNLEAALAKQNANLDTYKKKINELSTTIKIRRALLKTRRTELQQKQNEFRTKENKYIADKKQREKERNIIEKVRRIVNERLARMSQFLRSKVNQ